MFDGIGKTEIIIIAVVLLIIFGPKKLPEFAKGLSQAIKEVLGAFRGEEGGKKESKEK
ncbi:twin-arginine translocase TatA/TatE family subunit [Candidatus Dojkabacteria bacterium]|uniref:Twin-arginine translocase TatA/TatE family subunit n=1 Tax=Candidatus Dojkabacteria bacterium TaxID=2099670 RepID=A0A5C7J6J6_9BACT|nr:MAG: twin-arginine translocase TatA/TatE family subunit [Candidatus Dojkabacteria bacterium]